MSKEIVAQAKADLEAAGYKFDQDDQQARNDAAFLIIMEAASRIRGAGVFEKPSGNRANFEGSSYSVDIISFQDGRWVDALSGAGDIGGNAPAWGVHTDGDPSGWRQAVKVLTGDSGDDGGTGGGGTTGGTTSSGFETDVRGSLGRVEAAQATMVDALSRAVVALEQANPERTAFVKFALRPSKTKTGEWEANIKFDLRPKI